MPVPKPHPRIYRHGYASVNAPFLESRDARDGQDAIGAFQVLKRDLRTLFEYVEPCTDNVGTYSHRTFELLLRAATEVETNCKAIANANGHDWRDANITRYSDLDGPMRLSSYEVQILGTSFPPFTPFDSFTNPDRSQRSPPWYRGYNAAKHDRINSFPAANLQNVVHALGGLFTILTAQFGPMLDSVGITLDPSGISKMAYDMFVHTRQPSWSASEAYEYDWYQLKSSGPAAWMNHPFPVIT